MTNIESISTWLSSHSCSGGPKDRNVGSYSVQPPSLINTPSHDDFGWVLPDTIPYPSEKLVSVTKLMTRSVSETSVNRNLSFLLLRLLLARLNMGPTRFLVWTRPSIDPVLNKVRNNRPMMVNPTRKPTATSANVLTGIVLLPGYAK